MRAGNKVIHVRFISGVLNGVEDYFGSIVAIYDTFTSKQIGAGISVLREFKIEQNKPYKNKLVIIRLGYIKRKKGGRTAPIRVIRVNN